MNLPIEEIKKINIYEWIILAIYLDLLISEAMSADWLGAVMSANLIMLMITNLAWKSLVVKYKTITDRQMKL